MFIGCRMLQKLDLEDCKNVTDIGVEALIRHCNGLRELVLSSCERITDQGVVYIARSNNLERLAVDGCPLVTDSSLMYLETYVICLSNYMVYSTFSAEVKIFNITYILMILGATLFKSWWSMIVDS